MCAKLSSDNYLIWPYPPQKKTDGGWSVGNTSTMTWLFRSLAHISIRQTPRSLRNRMLGTHVMMLQKTGAFAPRNVSDFIENFGGLCSISTLAGGFKQVVFSPIAPIRLAHMFHLWVAKKNTNTSTVMFGGFYLQRFCLQPHSRGLHNH